MLKLLSISSFSFKTPSIFSEKSPRTSISSLPSDGTQTPLSPAGIQTTADSKQSRFSRASTSSTLAWLQRVTSRDSGENANKKLSLSEKLAQSGSTHLTGDVKKTLIDIPEEKQIAGFEQAVEEKLAHYEEIAGKIKAKLLRLNEMGSEKHQTIAKEFLKIVEKRYEEVTKDIKAGRQQAYTRFIFKEVVGGQKTEDETVLKQEKDEAVQSLKKETLAGIDKEFEAGVSEAAIKALDEGYGENYPDGPLCDLVRAFSKQGADKFLAIRMGIETKDGYLGEMDNKLMRNFPKSVARMDDGTDLNFRFPSKLDVKP